MSETTLVFTVALTIPFVDHPQEIMIDIDNAIRNALNQFDPCTLETYLDDVLDKRDEQNTQLEI